jgi:hypothetical protein
MARIIPDISGAFGMQRPHLQKFRRPQAPKRSGAQEAADIMSLIQSGVGTAAGLYGLGRGIYEDFRETDDEAVARLQREAIEQRAKFMQPGAATLEFGVKPEFAAPESVGWTDEPLITQESLRQASPTRMYPSAAPHFPSAQAPEITQAQMLEGIATGISPEQQGRRALDEPSYARSVAPEVIERAPLGTPEDKAVVEAAAELLKQEGNEDQIPALIEGLRGPEGRSRLELLKARLAEIIPAEMEAKFAPIQKAGMRALRSEILASEEQAERALPSAVTAREFLDRSFGGEQFNISDLASSYGGLMARGKEAEARELLRLARGAGDYASFITNPNEPPSLVEARARDAIKKGALAQPGERTIGLKEVSQIASMVSKGKGRKRKPTPSSKKKPPTGTFTVGGLSGFTKEEADDDVFVLVALARGLRKARNLARKEDERGQAALSRERALLQKGGGGLSDRTKKRLADWNPNWQTSVSTDASKRAETRLGRQAEAATISAAAQTKRAETGAEKAADKKKEGHKRALTSVGMRYSDAVGNVAAHKSDLASRVSNKKTKIAKAKASLRGRGEGKVTERIRAKIKALEGDIAVIVTAQNALDEIEAASAIPAALTVPTD